VSECALAFDTMDDAVALHASGDHLGDGRRRCRLKHGEDAGIRGTPGAITANASSKARSVGS
jgi:hypothetical protein